MARQEAGLADGLAAARQEVALAGRVALARARERALQREDVKRESNQRGDEERHQAPRPPLNAIFNDNSAHCQEGISGRAAQTLGAGAGRWDRVARASNAPKKPCGSARGSPEPTEYSRFLLRTRRREPTFLSMRLTLDICQL